MSEYSIGFSLKYCHVFSEWFMRVYTISNALWPSGDAALHF